MKQKRVISLSFFLMGVLYCICLVVSNLFGTKLVQVGSYSMTAGLIVFPISYIINDCVAEVWGFRKARLMIWTGFAMNFFVVLLGAIAVALPPAPYWVANEEHFDFVFQLAPRIAAASLVAFMTGSFLNAYVMSRMKLRDKENRFSLRAIVSTLIGEGADSLIFFPLAFGGLMPVQDLFKMMLLQVTAKTLYEILALPITVQVVKYVKRREGYSAYDTDVSYNPLKIKDI